MKKRALALVLCFGLAFSNVSVVKAEEEIVSSESSALAVDEDTTLSISALDVEEGENIENQSDEAEEELEQQEVNAESEVITESSLDKSESIVIMNTPDESSTFSEGTQESDTVVIEDEEEVIQKEAANEDELDSSDSTIVASGTCGNNASWKLENDGVLTVAGTGGTFAYDNKDPYYDSHNVLQGGHFTPWWNYKDTIKTVIIKPGITAIGQGNFSNCYNLTDVALPDGLSGIGTAAFYNTGLISVDLPDSLTDIGYNAFGACPYLESISIPGGVSVINHSFSECNSLKNVYLSEGITTLDDHAFSGCKIESIVIPDSVTTIGDSVFYKCRSLVDVSFSANVTNWGSDVFSDCGFESFEIPASMNQIKGVFSLCKNLKQVHFESGFTNMGDSLFAGCTSLENIEFPDNIKTIGSRAFSGCTKIKEIIIPDTINKIGEDAFSGCTGLERFIIPEGISQIGNWTSDDTGLKQITIPSTVTNIYQYAFAACPEAIIYYNGDQIAWDKITNSILQPQRVVFINYDVSVEPENANMVLRRGEFRQIEFTSNYDSEKNGNLLFESENPEIASVDSEGIVTANSTGEIEVYIKAENGIVKNSVQVAVVKENCPTKLSFKNESLQIGKGQTLPAMEVTYEPLDSTEVDVEFESSNPEIIRVNEDGTITGVEAGKAILYAKDGPCVAECNVDVVIIPVTGISLSETSVSVSAGKTYQLYASVLPEEASDKSITWKSGSTAIASVDSNGLVTAKKEGSVSIKATSNDNKDIYAYCYVSVIRPTVSLSLSQKTMRVGQKIALEKSITPDGEVYEGDWSSADESVASVDSNGYVTARGIGVTNIAYSINYEGTPGVETATCKINVVDTWNCIETDHTQLFVGDEVYLDYSGIQEGEGPVTWKYSSAGIVTVDDEGFLKALGYGHTTVTGINDNGEEKISCEVTVLAKGTCGLKAEWFLDEVGTLTISGSGAMKNYSSASSVPWANYRGNIRKCEIEEGITTIGNYAFYNCNKMESCKTNGSLATIGERAFQQCSSLTDVTIPASVSSIEKYAFNGCSKMSEITIPISVTKIGTAIFNGCSSLKNIFYLGTKDEWTAVNGYTYVVDQSLIRFLGFKVSLTSSTPVIIRENATKEIEYTTDHEASSIGVILWESSNPDIATVDSEGRITGIQTGETDIFLKAENGELKATIPVVVVGIAYPEEIRFEKESYVFEKGKEYPPLPILFFPDDSTERTILWESTDPDTLSIDSDGTFTTHKTGSVTLIAREGSCRAECAVTIVVLPERVSIEEKINKVETNNEISLSASVMPEETSNKNIIWTSSVPAVASIDQNGKIVGLKAGKTLIRAAAEEKPEIYDEYELEVVQRVSSISISESELSLAAGKTYQLFAEITPADSTDKDIIWSSEDSQIASVDENGIVSAMKAGTTRITATTNDGDKTAVCTVSVIRPEVRLNYSQKKIAIGKQIQLAYTTTPENEIYSGKWSSSDNSVASVNADGVVSTHSVGSANISYTITYNGDPGSESASCKITVTDTWDVNNISSRTLKIGESIYLDTSNCWDGSEMAINWNSSDTKIAVIDDDGFVTGSSNGTVTLKGTDEDGQHEITRRITVVTPVTELSLNNSLIEALSGESFNITATITPETASNTNILWATSDENIVQLNGNTVDANRTEGKFKVLSGGIATITAKTEDGGFTAKTRVVVDKAEEGETGKSIHWTITKNSAGDTYTLYVEGEGNMPDYPASGSPWSAYSDRISDIVVGDGVRSIGDNAFDNTRAEEVKIPDSVNAIGESAFSNNSELKKVSIPASVTEIGEDCFAGDDALIIVCYGGNEETWNQIIENKDLGIPSNVTIYTDTPEYISAETVVVSEKEEIEINESIQLTAEVLPENATSHAIQWTSSDESIVSVDQSGKVTGIAKGTASVFATSIDKDIRGECIVEVNSIPFTQMSISNIDDTVYSGTKNEPEVTVKNGDSTLKKGTDYSVSYKDNINAGIATVIITGTGNYEGEVEKTFKIEPASINGKEVSLSTLKLEYDGTARKPIVSVEDLIEETDYTVSYSNNINVGTAKVVITGKGNYTGSKEVNYTIIPASLDEKTVTLSEYTFSYDGKEKYPEVIIEGLRKGTDYDVSYEDNLEAGSARAYIKGKGNYSGLIEKNFNITSASIAEKKIILNKNSYVYDGNKKEPIVSIAGLNENSDYKIAYKNNINAGVSSVTVTGIGNYSGSLETTFKINPASLIGKEIVLNKTEYIYNGKEIKPTVSINGLKNGTDYKVSYKDNVNSGIATVRAVGIGNYSGSITNRFAIKKASNTLRVKTKRVKVKLVKLLKKKQKVATKKAFVVTRAQGNVTYKVAKYDKKAKKKIKVSKKGKITVKKGLKKGTYKLKVKVRAAGNANYKPATKTVTVKIRVK